ncbi:aldose epimerase family protein [Bacillus testis]|uniref:aldose epimerase family protein n=1 Tax=Bacillus testis TaxID=1622072 RepID=UPI00067EE3A7|nr:aldose epimerase family protein [Bacillus testis]
MSITKVLYGKVNQENIYQYTLANRNGIQVSCINYGCIITRMLIPDRNGVAENIVLGFDDIEDYVERNTPYLGGVAGRVAGRIKNGNFKLEGIDYELAQNDNHHHLHGGPTGFITRVWDAETEETDGEERIVFSRISPDGEEGYPGKVDVKVIYALNEQNQFRIIYEGVSDQTTILNLTNHSYFNLSGDAKSDVGTHFLKIDSDQFLELDHELLPTGRLLDVEGTPFDFREKRRIQDGIKEDNPQLCIAGGYDHPFILNSHFNKEIVLYEPASGRKMRVETDQPAVVVYTANSLTDETVVNGQKGHKHMAICLETQGYPDAVHHPHFQSIVLTEGNSYKAETVFHFSSD